MKQPACASRRDRRSRLAPIWQVLVTFQPARPRLALPQRRDVNSEGHRAMISQALMPPPGGGLPSGAGQFVARPVACDATVPHNLLLSRAVPGIH
jgi:hypothetical protein